MATARWFFTDEPNSNFVIQGHLRQGYWSVGPATMWIDALEGTTPYRAVGYWHETNFEMEWMPREYLLIRANQNEPELVRATTLQLGFKPARQYEEDGRYIVEWRVRSRLPDPALVPDPQPVAS